MTNETSLSATLWRGQKCDWQAAVDKTLGDREIESLIGRSDDGIAIGPIYERRDDSIPIHRRDIGKPWIIFQRVDDPDGDRSRETLRAELDGDATGIEFVFAGSVSAKRSGFGLTKLEPDMVTILSGMQSVRVRLDVGAEEYEHYEDFKELGLDELTVSFDPLADGAARGRFDFPLPMIEAMIVRTAKDFRDSGTSGVAVAADGRVWAAGGASEAQEIAAILGSIVHFTRALVAGGLSPREALDSIGLIVDAGAHQLLTIAKLRAVRLCHARIAEAFGAAPLRARLHAETSWRMMSRDDTHTNILRSTSAAFAAGIAGADSITVLPSTIAAGLPNAFARRVARNAQKILLEESGLARVDDPGAGSGAVEHLTEAIAEAAWGIFQRLEAGGGLAASLRAGNFQSEIARTRRSRADKIARREIAITGVSKYPSPNVESGGILASHPPAVSPQTVSDDTIARVPAVRFTEPFEALRDRAATLAHRGRPAGVFLARIGDTTEATEAAHAAINFFAIAGIAAVDAGSFDVPEAAARAFSPSGASSACIVGDGDALRRHAATTARALKANGAARVYVMGRSETDDAIDAVLDEKVDAIEILTAVLDASQ